MLRAVYAQLQLSDLQAWPGCLPGERRSVGDVAGTRGAWEDTPPAKGAGGGSSNTAASRQTGIT